MLSITIKFVKSAVACECGRVALSRKSAYFGTGKRILYFHIAFMPHALHFLLSTFKLYFPCFTFLLLIALESKLVKQISIVFIKGRPSVSQTYNLQRLKKDNIT